MCVRLCSALHKLYKCARARTTEMENAVAHHTNNNNKKEPKMNKKKQQPILTIGMESHTIN